MYKRNITSVAPWCYPGAAHCEFAIQILVCTVSNVTDARCDLQVVASHKGYTSAFQEGERLLGAAVQQALGPKQDKSALHHAATIADGLAVQYVIDAVRASSKQQGSAVEPKHIDTEPWC